MKLSTDNLILSLIAALTVAAATIVATGRLTTSPRGAERGFQRAVGGLGLGCQLDLARSSWQFDARIATESPVFGAVCELGQLDPWSAIALFPSPTGVRFAEEKD